MFGAYCWSAVGSKRVMCGVVRDEDSSVLFCRAQVKRSKHDAFVNSHPMTSTQQH
jgi:hypothetical protein